MNDEKLLGADAAEVALAGSIDSDAASHAEPTPGPWKVYDDGTMWVAPLDQDAAIICSLEPHGEEFVYSLEDDANAHLIAAAPELLEALSDLISYLVNCDDTPMRPAMRQQVTKGRAAIEKAVGRSK